MAESLRFWLFFKTDTAVILPQNNKRKEKHTKQIICCFLNTYMSLFFFLTTDTINIIKGYINMEVNTVERKLLPWFICMIRNEIRQELGGF